MLCSLLALFEAPSLDLPGLITMLLPVGDPDNFDPKKPRAADMKLEDVAKAKTLHLIISLVLVPLVGQGEKAQGILQEAVTQLTTALSSWSASLEGMALLQQTTS